MMNETEVKPWTTAEGVRILWEIASYPPERTRGILRDQLMACNDLWVRHRHPPALGRLNEIAAIKPSRTKGNLRGQQSAARALKRFLKSIKPDKNQGIQ
jgi:hypothetical protein